MQAFFPILIVALVVVLFASVAQGRKRYIFRLDDMEDYYNSDVQISILNYFMDNNVAFSAGIIGDFFTGQDVPLYQTLTKCAQLSKDRCAIFNHGADAAYLFANAASVAEAQAQVKKCDDKIKSLFPGYVPELMVPHQNSWSSNLLQALSNLGYLGVSASTDAYSNMPWDLSKRPIQMPQQTTTADYADDGSWLPFSASKTFSDCQAADARGEDCVVMIHPHEFSAGVYTFTMLTQLINLFKANGWTSVNFHTIITEQLGTGSTVTATPSLRPSLAPSRTPTVRPSVASTRSPSIVPTALPSARPTVTNTLIPTRTPTQRPSTVPTMIPTRTPTTVPSFISTVAPTRVPTQTPTVSRTATPTIVPTRTPTVIPTSAFTVTPTRSPTRTPTTIPTRTPTRTPTTATSVTPTRIPTRSPTQRPSIKPSTVPTRTATRTPSIAPTATFTATPSRTPTVTPTRVPTATPTILPTAAPSFAANQGGQYVCSAFSTSNTNGGMVNTVACTIVACRGHTMEVSLLGSAIVNAPSCVGDTYLRILDGSGVEIASNDNYNGNTVCSQVSFVASQQCTRYTIVQGCAGTGACSGTASIKSFD